MKKVIVKGIAFNAELIQSLSATHWEKGGKTQHAVKVTFVTESMNDKGYMQNKVQFVTCDSQEEANAIVNS